MPCYEPDIAVMKDAELCASNRKIAELEAILCAMLTVIDVYEDRDVYNWLCTINEKEAGVSATQIWKWWIKYKKKDEERIRLEKVAAAMNKLTDEEHDILKEEWRKEFMSSVR